VVQGILSSLFALGRGVFIGYNQDSQWSKYLIMEALDECAVAPTIMAAILDTLSIDERRAQELCQRGFITATDLMEVLVSEFAIPLRKGKVLVEKAVKYSESEGRETVSYDALARALQEMDLSLPISPRLVQEWQEPAACVCRRMVTGGPAAQVVSMALEELTAQLKTMEEWYQERSNQIQSAKATLEDFEKELFQHKP
jgi:argininosuccinate lyase